jgi:pyrimidine-specific ribonucleoside hydrolase
MTNIATLIQNHPILFRKSRKFLCGQNSDSFNPERQTECFDYNYEFDYKSMDVVLNSLFAIFLRVMSQVLTFIGNIDLASLDQNQEDKWLFDVVQPWMEKNEKFWCERLYSFDCSTLG